ncbi:MAG: DUF721 domain-containing protein [Leadbetterella sp.]
MARKSHAQPIKEAFENFLKAYNLDKKFDETYIISHWEKMMGSTIASRTSKIYIREGVLFLQITSASLKHDLVKSKTRIIELLNGDMGKSVIKEIVFL